jgi:protein-tyrosine phosphatase
MRQVLFLCTGNFYRSRFAEAVFNHLAVEAGLDWRATSRGLRLTAANVGPISPYTVAALTARGILLAEPERDPLAVAPSDLAGADLIVAVSDDEHRPMVVATVPDWADHITYWRVEDLHLTPADDALAALDLAVHRLVDDLRQSQ